MEVFLPIAEVSVNIVAIFSLSTIVGILSGLFGVGGGFLMTPFLIFMGIPPTYAVANEANNILATSVSGSTTHWLKNTLDYKMGLMIVSGGAADILSQATEVGLDAYLTGEGANHHYHESIESECVLFLAGHYATETGGVKSVGKHLEAQFGIKTEFLDYPTGM